tara:strand:+ start:414 stop:1049 length:636 start_codon:yes stop_codon:yes gene_type:complete
MDFINAEEAFGYFYDNINRFGEDFDDTKAIFNVGFYIHNPLDKLIRQEFRGWNKDYAEFEWKWYVKGDPNGLEISKRAPIWNKHMDELGDIRSNYGWQWNRESQLDRIIDKLHADKNTRQAVLSFYDGKEIGTYQYDTPCTNSVHFQIIKNKLCMTVNMRSNDIWFGFCNDQYCFSKLQELVAKELEIEVGWYYHFSSNMHLYKKHLNLKK